jgi:putative nucleotidyltransferase with HDIG domain
MTSFLRRLFGESEPARPTQARETSSAGAGSASASSSRASVAQYAPAPRAPDAPDRSLASTHDGGIAEGLAGPELQHTLQTRVLAALKRVETELVSDDAITADLALLIQSLREHPINEIRQLPVAAQRALSMIHDDASTGSLVELFEQDPAISQALLKQVNSAFYNPNGSRVVSLSDAIGRMGLAGVQGVVMQQTVAGMVSRPGGQLDAMVTQVWDHMVRTAPLSRYLAPHFDANPDKAFLLGLLHDVGKLAVFDRITELRSTLRRPLVLERHMMGRALTILHAPLGGLIVEQWKLDSEVARAVANHHRNPRPTRRDVLSEVVYVAERLDLSRAQKQFIDLPEMWEEAGLTASLLTVSKAISDYSWS